MKKLVIAAKINIIFHLGINLIFGFIVAYSIIEGIITSIDGEETNYTLFIISLLLIVAVIILLMQFFLILRDIIKHDIIEIKGRLFDKYSDINPFLRRFNFYFIINDTKYQVGPFQYNKVKKNDEIVLTKLKKSNLTVSVLKT